MITMGEIQTFRQSMPCRPAGGSPEWNAADRRLEKMLQKYGREHGLLRSDTLKEVFTSGD